MALISSWVSFSHKLPSADSELGNPNSRFTEACTIKKKVESSQPVGLPLFVRNSDAELSVYQVDVLAGLESVWPLTLSRLAVEVAPVMAANKQFYY